jgi:adenylate cyclase
VIRKRSGFAEPAASTEPNAFERKWKRFAVYKKFWSDVPHAVPVLACILFLLALLALREIGAFSGISLAAYDRLVMLRADRSADDPRVVQISITESDISRYGWPLADGLLAEAVLRLHDADARAIGIDIFRSTPIAPGTSALEDAIHKAPEVIWAERFQEGNWGGIPAPVSIQALDRGGFADLVLDHDAVTRRSLLYLSHDGHWKEAFSLKLALLYLEAKNVLPTADRQGFLRLGKVPLPPFDKNVGGYTHPDTRGYQILRTFQPFARIRTFAFPDLLEGRVPSEALRDHIVVVGIVADSVKDSVMTPINAGSGRLLPGVTVHGLFAAQLVAHGLDGLVPTHALPRWMESVLIGLIVMAGMTSGIILRRFSVLAAIAGGGSLLLPVACYLVFLGGIWLPIVPLTAGWLGAAVLSAAGLGYAERAQRAVLMRLFSAHVSAPIAQELWQHRAEFLADGRPVAMRLNATVLFSDINDFTGISECLESETIVDWLNPYMEAMSTIVSSNNGVIERLAGDCVMAMFGPPLARQRPEEREADALGAVRCAGQMCAAMEELNTAYRQAGLPEMRVGIGVHSGVLVGCSLGSRERQQYATIGDTTNTAARLMTEAKRLVREAEDRQACMVVISEMTRMLVKDAFHLSPIGMVIGRGKAQPIECYALMGHKSVQRRDKS